MPRQGSCAARSADARTQLLPNRYPGREFAPSAQAVSPLLQFKRPCSQPTPGVNGIYALNVKAGKSDNLPIFTKGIYSLYRYNGVWHLGVMGTARRQHTPPPRPGAPRAPGSPSWRVLAGV